MSSSTYNCSYCNEDMWTCMNACPGAKIASQEKLDKANRFIELLTFFGFKSQWLEDVKSPWLEPKVHVSNDELYQFLSALKTWSDTRKLLVPMLTSVVTTDTVNK